MFLITVFFNWIVYLKFTFTVQIEIEALKKEIQEKQELLSQAARAFELHEEQKEEANRNQELYEQSLENERQRIEQLQRGMSHSGTYSL